MAHNTRHIRHLPPHIGAISLAQAVTYVGCRRILSSRSLKRLRSRYNGRLPKDIEVKLEDASRSVMIMLVRGDFSALGSYQAENKQPSSVRKQIPTEFLKDGAWADPFTDTITTDWMAPQHFAGSLQRYRYVRLDRDAFFRAIDASDEQIAAPLDQSQKAERNKNRTRTRSKEDDAILRNRIESILAAARRLDPKHRTPIRALAIELANDPANSQYYRTGTIRQILSGTYRPMKRLKIYESHHRPVDDAANAG